MSVSEFHQSHISFMGVDEEKRAIIIIIVEIVIIIIIIMPESQLIAVQ